MATVTIDDQDFDTYVTLAEAQDYAIGSLSADDWRAADADTQSRAVVSATRLIDRQQWQGLPTDPTQLHAFPRTGLTYTDGSPVDSATVPQQVLDACCELAIAIVGGSTAQDQTSTDPNTRSLKAGSVEIVYFRNLPQGLRFPLPVQELIGLWLAGAVAALDLAISSGTCARSEFKRDPDFVQAF